MILSNIMYIKTQKKYMTKTFTLNILCGQNVEGCSVHGRGRNVRGRNVRVRNVLQRHPHIQLSGLIHLVTFYVLFIYQLITISVHMSQAKRHHKKNILFTINQSKCIFFLFYLILFCTLNGSC